MNPKRLSGRKTNAYVQRKGRVWKGQTMMIRWLPGVPSSLGRPKPLPDGVYMGTYAATSLDGSAVKRNRMRRRCREALRLALKKRANLPGMQLLASPRSASLDAPFEAVLKDAETFFSTLRS